MMSSNHNTTDYRNPFAERLSDLMKNKGITQDMLSKYCYVTRQSVGKWVTGQSTPDIDNLAKIADYFDVSTDYLVGRNDYKTTNKATKELCQTLGLSERSIDFLRKDLPLHFQEWEKSDAVITFDVAQTVLILDALLEDHIDYLMNKDNRRNKKQYSLLILIHSYLDHITLSGNASIFSKGESLPIDDVNESLSIDQKINGGLFSSTLYSLKDVLIAQDIQNITTFLQTQSIKGIDRGESIDNCYKIGGDKK